MKLSIAVAQFTIAHLDKTKNLSIIEAYIEQAAREKAQVIIFPEDCVTGCIFGDTTHLIEDKEIQETFQKLAKTYGIDIVSGSCMEKTESGVFNTSYYINAEGRILGKYQKNHLYDSEKDFISPGTEISVFDTAYGKAGIIICWDILFAEIFERMKEKGVQIIYCPSYWYKEIAGDHLKANNDSEENLIDALCVARAREHGIIFVYANAAGIMRYKDGSFDTLIGHSQIAAPYLASIKKLDHNRDEMFVREIEV